jgi:hypothetical protein
VTLAFNSTAPEWKYLRGGYITILAHGRRYGPASLELLNTKVETKGGVSEAVAVTVGAESFLRIVNSRGVEMQVGNAEFSLDYRLLEAIRDSASRMRGREACQFHGPLGDYYIPVTAAVRLSESCRWRVTEDRLSWCVHTSCPRSELTVMLKLHLQKE